MDSTTQLLPLERDETTGDGRLAGCVTVRLEQRGGGASSVVVLNLELIQRLEATLREVARDPKATCLVLASASERVFVAGADLKTILEQGDEELDRYLAYGQQVFGMLADLPFPTVAAINGAALDVERRELVRLRSTPEGKGAIRAFFDRSAGKK